jgi:pSer/pThr/pTyr-binding forkhead associated (FHA) protein
VRVISDLDRIVIGKSDDADVVISSDESVSEFHAELERVGTRWMIRDLDSTNATLVNGRRISGDRLLVAGDEIILGQTRIRFDDAQPPFRGDGDNSGDRHPRRPVMPSAGLGAALDLPDGPRP